LIPPSAEYILRVNTTVNASAEDAYIFYNTVRHNEGDCTPQEWEAGTCTPGGYDGCAYSDWVAGNCGNGAGQCSYDDYSNGLCNPNPGDKCVVGSTDPSCNGGQTDYCYESELAGGGVTPGDDPAACKVQVKVPRPDPLVWKTIVDGSNHSAKEAERNVGDALVYELHIKNPDQTQHANGTTLTDVLPTQVDYVNYTQPSGEVTYMKNGQQVTETQPIGTVTYDAASRTISWTVPAEQIRYLEPGAEYALQVNTIVNSSFSDSEDSFWNKVRHTTTSGCTLEQWAEGLCSPGGYGGCTYEQWRADDPACSSVPCSYSDYEDGTCNPPTADNRCLDGTAEPDCVTGGVDFCYEPDLSGGGITPTDDPAACKVVVTHTPPPTPVAFTGLWALLLLGLFAVVIVTGLYFRRKRHNVL
jgi:fimbrial isopeptide formation D2 family protein